MSVRWEGVVYEDGTLGSVPDDLRVVHAHTGDEDAPGEVSINMMEFKKRLLKT